MRTWPQALARLPAWAGALIVGLVAALAHPPFGFIPGLLAYGVLMRLGDAAPTLRSAFWRGWLAGTAYFALGCWWVAEAFFVDAETFGWMAPFAVTFLAGGLGLFWGLGLTLYRWIRPTRAWRVLVFAGSLAAFEWVRGHIFTGFPWNLPGVSWGAGGLISQSAHLFGAYGLTWITLAVSAAPILLVEDLRRRSHQVAVGLAAAAVVAMAGYGAVRIGGGSPGEVIRVRAVQPNVPQEAKYDLKIYQDIVDRYLRLTSAPPSNGGPAPQVIVWPEGALPRSLDAFLAPGDPTREAIIRALQPGQVLILGGYRSEPAPGEDRFYNTLIALRRSDTDLEVLGLYDKHHLVPFGEYVPKFLMTLGLQQLVPLSAFTPGPKPQPLDIGLARIQPLICYEGLFPGYTWRGEQVSGRSSDVIVNISNDAWFGQTSGPVQHLNQARYRAIEEGLPMIRATPTGISSVIDKYGRVSSSHRISLGDSGMVDAELRVSHRKDVTALTNVHPTPSYIRLSDWGFVVMLTLSGLICLRHREKSTKKA